MLMVGASGLSVDDDMLVMRVDEAGGSERGRGRREVELILASEVGPRRDDGRIRSPGKEDDERFGKRRISDV